MLKVRETTFPHTTFLELTGQFDYHSIHDLEARIMGTHELGCKHVILDFEGVTGIDSIILGQLFLWYHKLQPHHVTLYIANPQPRIREVLEQSHMSDLVPIKVLDLESVNLETLSK